MATSRRWVYSFGGTKAEGRGDQKELLGGKGAGLAEMTRIGLPVPHGFTITTEACAEFNQRKRKWPAGLEKQIRQSLAKMERTCKKKLGAVKDPLLVSVRSGDRRTCAHRGLHSARRLSVATLVVDRWGRPGKTCPTLSIRPQDRRRLGQPGRVDSRATPRAGRGPGERVEAIPKPPDRGSREHVSGLRLLAGHRRAFGRHLLHRRRL